ncbi:MAG: hypothetical protein Q9176_003176 [Flavoplaca citrina]
MASPTRSLRRSPPRRPLHERSDSEANERASPTSRFSADAQDYSHKITPYPTHPSHVLSPKKASRPGLVPKVWEDEDEPDMPLASRTANRIQYDHHSSKTTEDTRASEHVENHHGSSIRPLSIGNTMPISVHPLNFNPPERFVHGKSRQEEDADDGNRASDEIVQLPSLSDLAKEQEPAYQPLKPSLVPPQIDHTVNLQPIDAKSSDLSLSSSDSTGTIIRHTVRPSRGSYSAFPPVSRPTSSKSGSSPPTPQRTFAPSSEDGMSRPTSTGSTFFQQTHQPLPAAISRPHRAVSDVVNFQYPVVRQPSTSSSRAQTSNNPQGFAIPRPQPQLNRKYDRWNPHLSTVPSEFSEERASDHTWVPSSIGMSTSSLDVTRQPSTHQSRDMTGSTIRMVNESDDNVCNLLSPIPGSRGSAYYSVLSGGSRNKRRSVPQARPTSKGSFFRDSIPAWAKLYYARSNSALNLAGGRSDLNLAASSESLGVRRTRQRPNINTQNQNTRDSMIIGPAPPNGAVLAEVHGQPRQPISQVWSPHLWHDRRNIVRGRSVFKAPSLDEHIEGPFGRRNVQVLLFPLGFIVPFAWFIAALLPLPQRPAAGDLPEADAAPDLAKTLCMMDEARYENARWWRNLNRLMCIVGVLIIIAIIALAVVATHMRN